MTNQTHSHGKHVADDPSVDDFLLVERVREAIDASYLRRWFARQQVTCHRGVVIISGRLPSYYLKQVLQTIIRPIPGVQGIENRVLVDPGSASREGRSAK